MSDPNHQIPKLSDIYIAKEFDKTYQIGMVLSHAEASTVRHDDFYTCLEIMTSRFSAQVNSLNRHVLCLTALLWGEISMVFVRWEQ